MLDWLRAFNQGDPAQFDGQPADVIGFVYSEPSFGANQFMVARFAISCCVADATAIGVPVFWDQTANFKQGEWIEVKGTFAWTLFGAIKCRCCKPSRIDPVEQPEHPYLYP